MNYIADLHIHSCYSRATSKASRLPGLAAWAAIKGIQVLGTGDFTHPGWFAHLQENLVPAEEGMFALKEWDQEEIASLVPPEIDVDRLQLGDIRFVLSAEISSIYKKDGRVRKIHNILYAPDFTSVRRINAALGAIGNLESDGRPILGLDARELLAITLEHAPEGFFVPAHIWTPWFSLFGSKSGFEAIEECFADLTTEIFALETGLSSDPDMNRCISALDNYTLVSNSDSHSPAKLGREANIFATDLGFAAMKEAIRAPVDTRGKRRFLATVEFYPEEGKYHCDGHRKCNICLEPDQTRNLDSICPVCGRPLTIGVLHRVMDLADRTEPLHPDHAPGVHSLIPLPEIFSELHGVGPTSKTVLKSYARAINTFGSEFSLLLETPIAVIKDKGSSLLAEAVDRVRKKNVIRQPGYDGAYGVIRVFDPDELARMAGQLELFGQPVGKRRMTRRTLAGQGTSKVRSKPKKAAKKKDSHNSGELPLNTEQSSIVSSGARHILVQAGPGTGKTHTLVSRLLHQLQTRPEPATVITFTNKAAREIRERIELGADNNLQKNLLVATLHGFCLRFLRLHEPRLQVAGPEMRTLLLKKLIKRHNQGTLLALSANISRLFACCREAGQTDNQTLSLGREYARLLDAMHLIDLDAVVPCALNLLKQDGEAGRAMRDQARYLYIDEFQDLNEVQYQLVRELATTSAIFAIGDPDQAIYGFRGADPQWFYRFARELAPARFHLGINYRCGAHILEAAAAVISANSTHGPEARSSGSETGALFLRKCSSPEAEAYAIVQRIEELLGGTSHREIDRLRDETEGSFSLRDLCVLYRTGRQADVLAQVFHEHGIPFQRVDFEPFYLQKPLSPVVDWLLVLTGRADLSHLLSLLSREHGIGSATIARVEDALFTSQSPVYDFISFAVQSERLRPVARRIEQMTQQLNKNATQKDLRQALLFLVQHIGLDGTEPECKRFFDLACSVADTPEALAGYILDNRATIFNDVRTEAVSLMTLHAAKGVEFPVVFITGLEEGTLPLAPRDQLGKDAFCDHIEEERRLFYVGMTRAEQRLYCTWSEKRRAGALTAGEKNTLSRFIAEIPEQLLNLESHRPRRKKFRQLSLF